MAKFTRLLVLLNIANSALAIPGILQSETLITRNEVQVESTGSPTNDQIRPQPSDSPVVTISGASNTPFRRHQPSFAVSNDSATPTSTSVGALKAFKSALSTYEASSVVQVSFDKSAYADAADLTTQSNNSRATAQQSSGVTTAMTAGISSTTTTQSPRAWTTTTVTASFALQHGPASSVPAPEPAPSKVRLELASLTKYNASARLPSATSSSESQTRTFSTTTTVVIVSEPTSSAVSQDSWAAVVQLDASQAPAAPPIQCAYDHIIHADNDEYVQQNQMSCGTALATDDLWDTASSTESQTLTSSLSPAATSNSESLTHASGTPKPTSTTEALPVGVQEALKWLSQTTDSSKPERTRTQVAAEEATHTSAAGGDRVRLRLW